MPENVPIAAPRTTSLAQCLLLYILESPTSVAAPYMVGATSQVWRGHHRCDSLVTVDASANAAVAWPDGNDCRFPFVNPRPKWKSCGFVSSDTNGLARPDTPLRNVVATPATARASAPCSPKSATFLQ